MTRRFEAFLRESEDGTPHGIQFRAASKPAGMVVATFVVDREMPDEMALLAGDLVHNTRAALDHTLAQLKEHFGGNPASRSSPICRTSGDWRDRVIDAGRRSPLRGLGESAAFTLIQDEQPLHRDRPDNDPLVILNKLDNDDKHRLLRPAFVYPRDGKGTDLIEVIDRRRVMRQLNHWTTGQPLEHGTPLATYMTRGPADPHPLRARADAQIGFATGELSADRVGSTDMIECVRSIVDQPAALIDGHPVHCA
jgi:hypothetical protein